MSSHISIIVISSNDSNKVIFNTYKIRGYLHLFLERYIFVTKLNLLTELSIFPFFF